jgi:hypothetical protein
LCKLRTGGSCIQPKLRQHAGLSRSISALYRSVEGCRMREGKRDVFTLKRANRRIRSTHELSRAAPERHALRRSERAFAGPSAEDHAARWQSCACARSCGNAIAQGQQQRQRCAHLPNEQAALFLATQPIVSELPFSSIASALLPPAQLQHPPRRRYLHHLQAQRHRRRICAGSCAHLLTFPLLPTPRNTELSRFLISRRSPQPRTKK